MVVADLQSNLSITLPNSQASGAKYDVVKDVSAAKANTVALYSSRTGMACSDEGIPHKPPKFYYDNLSIAKPHTQPQPQLLLLF